MAAWQIMSLSIGIALSIAVIGVSVLYLRFSSVPDSMKARPAPFATATRPAESKRSVTTEIRWNTWWTHDAPPLTFTVAEAHQEMQRHRGCSAQSCPRKAAAFSALVESGRIQPDSSRYR